MRFFRSAKAAIAHATVVRLTTGGPSRPPEQVQGSGADPDVVCAIFAAFARAGVDPHGALASDVCAWATVSDDAHADEQRAAKIGAAVGRIARELLAVGLVRPRPRPAATHAKATRLGDRVMFSTVVGPGPNRTKVAAELAAGKRAPAPATLIYQKTPREAVLEEIFDAHEAGELDWRGVDEQIQARLGVSAKRAGNIRRQDLGIFAD